jgi:subtilisin family serine protease
MYKMRIPSRAILTGLLVLSMSAPLIAARRFILDAPAAEAPSIASRYGLTLVKQIRNHDLALVTAPDSIDPAQLVSQVNSEPTVYNFELDAAIASSESQSGIQLNQSTGAILDGISGFTATTYFGVPVPSYFVVQPAANLIRLIDAQSEFSANGSGVVAVIDTGVDPDHPVLKASLLRGYDFTRGITGASEMLDLDPETAAILNQSTGAILDKNVVVSVNQSTGTILDQSTASILDTTALPSAFGHGTMVAGLIHLVCPSCKILPLKAFQGNGKAHLFDIIDAIYFAADNGAKIVSMSFSMATSDKIVFKAMNNLNSRGIICVSSVGNSGQKIQTFPAALDNVLGIASTTNNDQRSSFSNYGPAEVDLAAPGEGVITTYPGSNYAAGWGTSFSTPLVSGAAGVLLQFKPNLNESNADTYLSFAQKLTNDLGAGRLDLYRAVQKAQ